MKILHFIIMLFVPLQLMAAGGKSLVISFSDATTQTFLLSTQPEVMVTDNRLIVKTSTSVSEYQLSDVYSFTFREVTGVHSLVSESDMVRNGDTMVFSRLLRIEAFTADGRHIHVPYYNINNTTVIHLNSLPAGITILKASGRTIKLCR